MVPAQAKYCAAVLPATYPLLTDVYVAVTLALAQYVNLSLQFIGSTYYDELVPISISHRRKSRCYYACVALTRDDTLL